MLCLVHKWLEVALATLTLPVVSKHEEVLALTRFFVIGNLIFKVITNQSLNLLMKIELSLDFFFNIIKLKLMLAVDNFLCQKFFDFILRLVALFSNFINFIFVENVFKSFDNIFRFFIAYLFFTFDFCVFS